MIDEHCCDGEIAIDAESDRIVAGGPVHALFSAAGLRNLLLPNSYFPGRLRISGSQFRIDP
jgi:hypothetical protein